MAIVGVRREARLVTGSAAAGATGSAANAVVEIAAAVIVGVRRDATDSVGAVIVGARLGVTVSAAAETAEAGGIRVVRAASRETSAVINLQVNVLRVNEVGEVIESR